MNYGPNKPLGALLTVLRKNEKCFVVGIGGMSGPNGRSTTRKVRRERDGRVWLAQLVNMADSDPLMPRVGRSLLVQLGLNPEDYGF